MKHPHDIDPVDYPYRALFAGPDPRAPTVIAWMEAGSLPLSDELIEVIDNAFVTGGHVLVLARTQEMLDRAGAVVSLIAGPYLIGNEDNDEREFVC